MSTELPVVETENPPRPDRCETCMFWDDRVPDAAGFGRCRRFPPTHSQFEEIGEASAYTSNWVDTESFDWCGEWKAKEPIKLLVPLWSEFLEPLSGRARSRLFGDRAYGDERIESIEQLLSFTADDLLMRPNLGMVTVNEIRLRLAEFGLHLLGDKCSTTPPS